MSDEQAPAASEEQAQPSAPREIKAGEKTYTIGRFMGYKAFRIGRALTGLGEIGPEVSKRINAYVAEYREANVDRISRATLEFRYPEEAAGVSNEAWKESGGYIELAQEPSQAEILTIVLPTAFDLAGDKIADLLAWVVADDATLEEKDNDSEEAVAAYIGELRKELLFRCAVDELLDLALAAQDVLRDQLSGKGEGARSLLKLVGLDPESEEEPEDDGEKPETASMTIEYEEKDETPSTPKSPTMSERPDSSIDSPEPTAGSEESSTASVGEPLTSTSG